MKNLKETRLWVIRQHSIVVLVSTLIVLTCVAPAPGQLGMGDNKGIAQQKLKPRLVRISGKLQEIKTHPCENTTGKAELGTHLILKDKHGRELNIHLGPTSSDTIKWLTNGTMVDLFGFLTKKMSPNHYVAKTLILPNHVIPLRDSDLRPYWSNNRLVRDVPSRFAATTGRRRTSDITDSFRYYPKYWQRCCFQDKQRPRWRWRCCGRVCARKLEWDN